MGGVCCSLGAVLVEQPYKRFSNTALTDVILLKTVY